MNAWHQPQQMDSVVRAQLLSGLAEPTRLRIVEHLKSGPSAVGKIADDLEISQPQTSKHLKMLRKAGLVNQQVNGNHRIYSLRPEPFLELDDWLSSFRTILEARYDRLDDYIQKLQADKAEQEKDR